MRICDILSLQEQVLTVEEDARLLTQNRPADFLCNKETTKVTNPKPTIRRRDEVVEACLVAGWWHLARRSASACRVRPLPRTQCIPVNTTVPGENLFILARVALKTDLCRN